MTYEEHVSHARAPMRSADLDKIRSDELRAIARDDAPSRRVVVAKLRSQPGPQIAFTRASSGRVRPTGFDPAENANPEDAFAAAARAIAETVGAPVLNAFWTSSALVIEVDGPQLRRLAELPEVEQIYLNDPR